MGFFMSVSNSELLDYVDECIVAVMSGQEVTVSGKRLINPDLSALYKMRKELRNAVSRENGGGLSINYGIPRRD
jgi:hypothetical protein